jgi:hypothetical protein
MEDYVRVSKTCCLCLTVAIAVLNNNRQITQSVKSDARQIQTVITIAFDCHHAVPVNNYFEVKMYACIMYH